MSLKHYQKIILIGFMILGIYSLILAANYADSLFSVLFIGLFVLPLGISVVTIGFIERHYKKDED